MGSLVRRALLLPLLALLLPGAALANAHAQHEHYSADMANSGMFPNRNDPLTVAIQIDQKPGWHIYWSTSGESGYPPSVIWTMPAGWTAGPLRHPTPTTLVAGGLVSYVHEGNTVLLQDIAVPAEAPRGQPVTLRADIDLLICNEGNCVPDPVTLETTVMPGSGGVNPTYAALYAKARAIFPQPSPAPGRYTVDAGMVKVFLPGLNATSPATLFLDQADAAKPMATAQVTVVDGGIVVSAPMGAAVPSGTLSGVLRMGGTGHAFTANFAATLGEQNAAGQNATGFDAAFAMAFLTAILGGLILNLMPCVFPILSLKALALARYGDSNAKARSEALGYSLGTIGTITALGAVLLALRSGGAAVGWAFQLQSPAIVGALLLLVTAIAVNLAGVFELPSLSVNSTGNHEGFGGAMATGALAAFIATPCTGPFMAGALGAALVMPPVPALAVMAGLGVGMALPFFLIGFFPPLRRMMPRPGNWMVTLRHLLAVPMFATALGLAWIVGRQGGVSAMTAALGAALLLAMGLWWYGARQKAGQHGWPAAGVTLAAFALGIVSTAAVPAGANVSTGDTDALHSVAFDTARLSRLTAEGKPVFLYLTADWCLSCKVNEATSLSSAQVADAFQRAHVTVMRGDWTRQDPAIASFLREHGRAGVPLYLWYPAGGHPRELPQVLTPGMLTGLVQG